MRPAATAEALAECRDLFLEYHRALATPAAFDDFAAELAGLPGQYAPPGGRLVLGLVGGRPAGCVALRSLFHRDAEMKRLYVRPAHRGSGLGRILATHMVSEARAAGYETLKLDTLPQLTAAIRLYGKLGFRDTAPYHDSPVPGLRYFALDLTRPPVAVTGEG